MAVAHQPIDAGADAPAVTAAVAQPWPSPTRAYYTVFVMALVVMFAEVDRSIMSLLVQGIEQDLHISDALMGLLMGAAFAIFYAAFGLPLGRYVDRSNRKNLLAIALAVWSTATVCCGIAQNFVQLAIARVFLGAGESVNGPAIFSIISDSFRKERLPRAIALMQIGVTAGNAFALIMGAVVIGLLIKMPPQHFGPLVIRWWQMVFIVIGVPGLLVAVVNAVTVKEPPRRGARDTIGLRQTIAYLWAHKPVFLPMYGSMFVTGLAMGVITWVPAFYQRTYAWSAHDAGMALGVTSLIATPIGLFLGVMAAEALTRRGYGDSPYRVIVWGRLITLLPVLLQPLMPTPWLALLCQAGYLIGVGATGSCTNAVLQIVLPNNMRGQATALFMFFYSVVGNGLSPSLLGLISTYGFHDPAKLRYAILLVNVLFMPASLLVFWLGIGPYRRELKRLGLDAAPAAA
jgi:MFS family permease